MPVTLLYRTRYTPEQFAKVTRDRKRTRTKLEAANAYAPMTIWQRPDIPEAYLTLLEYENLDVAETGFELYTELASSINSSGFQGEGAPDALLMNVKTRVRARPQDAPLGSLISLSIRIAEPGYAKELLADLDTVFQELDAIGGLLGYSFGTRVGMSEEVLGMGIWAKFSDFETSLPTAPKNSELRVYRRVALGHRTMLPFVNVMKNVKRGVLVLLLLGPGLTALAKDPFRPSVKEQIHLGEEVSGEIRRELHVLPADDIRVKILRRIGRKILSTFPASETWQYSFDVIDSKDVNAFALPGGPTFFYTGLLDRLKSEDEIAGIMGHELTHVRQQHWARIYGDSQKRQLLLTGAFLLLRVNYTGAQVADLLNNLLDLKYSRTDEAAADEGGFVNSSAAGYNPQGLADAFVMLDKLGGHDPEFLSDHPSDAKRIQHIEDDIKNSGKTFPPQRPLPWPAKEDPPKK